MSNELDFKYEVEIKTSEKKQLLPKEVKEQLKESGMMDEKGKLKINGVSGKMLKRMKGEYVECPVLKETIQFIPYNHPNICIAGLLYSNTALEYQLFCLLGRGLLSFLILLRT